MNPKIFISYSRREVPFVNSLAADLEDDDFDIWLDFRSLVPGSPWGDQINAAIDNTDVVLIVVSSSSQDSEYVQDEMERVYSLNKRVVLAIFESAKLEKELLACEWVDFRGSYKKALKDLKRVLREPEPVASPAPEEGFKTPAMVWVAFGLSIIVALVSFPAIWTIWIPLRLLTLPKKILTRDFDFYQTQAALLLLPFALFFTNEAVSDAIWKYTANLEWYCLPIVLLLFFVLQTPTLQRWGKPIATSPSFANPYDPDVPNPKSTSFCIEHAPQDAKVANEIANTLLKYGHKQVFEVGGSEVVLVLVSVFYSNTQADPENQIVYPIILQTVDENKISKSLRRIQWIDYRRGVRNLNELAELLPQPERLLKALAIRPMGRQLILPMPVMATVYFWGALAMFNAGACLPYVIQFSDELSDGPALFTLLVVFACLGLFGLIVNFAIRQLVQRKSIVASWWGMFIVTVFLGGILYFQIDLVELFENIIQLDWATDFRGISARQPIELFVYGNIFLGAYLLWSRQDMMNWFPSFNNLKS